MDIDLIKKHWVPISSEDDLGAKIGSLKAIDTIVERKITIDFPLAARGMVFERPIEFFACGTEKGIRLAEVELAELAKETPPHDDLKPWIGDPVLKQIDEFKRAATLPRDKTSIAFAGRCVHVTPDQTVHKKVMRLISESMKEFSPA